MSKKITFEDFMNSKVRSENLEETLGDCCVEGLKGYVYLDGFYIQDYEDEYMLCVLNDSWVTSDLSDLEKRLWDFADGEMNL